MSKVLLIIPHDRFHDDELKVLSDFLRAEGHEISIGSSHHTEAQGHFGQLVKPDVEVKFVEQGDYDALVFIGGRGIDEYIQNTTVTNLVRSFNEGDKLIGALGRGVEILIYAGIITGRRVTCDISTIPQVQTAGAYYTGNLVVEDENIITGTGVEASQEFAKTLGLALKWKNSKGELYARTTGS